MTAGLLALTLAYVLSQFYRAFLAVLAPWLAADLGATPEDLAAASGVWFLAFALAQLPVGWALDRIGPGITTAVLLGCGAVGAGLFATAQGTGALTWAMALIGLGCAPVLMAAYVILTRRFSAAAFATLAGALVGVGSIGNLAAALPLTLAAEALGWRGAMWAMAGVTAAVALVVALAVREPPVPLGAKGSLWDLLRMRAIWPVLAMMAVCYAPVICLRGLWIGPYMVQVTGADAGMVGRATLVMALAMIAGSFAYGPLERLFASRKRVILGGNLVTLALILVLARVQAPPAALAIALFAGIGFFGSTYALTIAHGRAFLAPHLVGRGVTLLNLFGIGSAGLLQFATGRLFAAVPAGDPAAPFMAVFVLVAGLLAAGLACYALARDRTD